MATITRETSEAGARVAQAGYPAGGLRFDWAMTGLSALFLAGLWIDAWAHFHGEVDDSFFTPWHFLFYSAFGCVALFLGYHQARNVGRGHGFARALPRGYWLSLVGVGAFALGGLGDMVWHTLFGIEGGTEALMSPSHILLAIGMALVFTGPARAVWLRGAATGWRALGPMVASMALFLTLLLFFFSYANPVVNPLAAVMARAFSGQAQDFGVTMILLTSAIISAVSLLLCARWTLPFGTFTLLLGFSTMLLTLLNDVYALIPGAILAGLLTDALYRALRPTAERQAQYIAFAFAAPVIYFALYFVSIEVIDRVRWSVHVWSGSIFIAGTLGALLAVLLSAARARPEA